MNKKILTLAISFFIAGLACVAFLIFWEQPQKNQEKLKNEKHSPSAISSPLPASPTSKTQPHTLPPSQSLTDWEQNLDTILSAPGSNANAAKALIQAIPNLPVEAQEQYISHALNLCEDEDFAGIQEIYLRPGTPPSIAESIFNDALNRPEKIKLPLMAKTIETPNHPMAGEAKRILEFYLDLQPEERPSQSWSNAVQQFLLKQ